MHNGKIVSVQSTCYISEIAEKILIKCGIEGVH